MKPARRRRKRCRWLSGPWNRMKRCERWAGAGSVWCTQHRKRLVSQVCREILIDRVLR